MQTIYCISGLGADHRVFQHLQSPRFKLVYLDWLPPQKDESIHQYAQRMAVAIEDEDALLLGLSFGGMMAIEIGKLIPTLRIILVSSVRSRKELPRWMLLCGFLHLYALLPKRPIGTIPVLRVFRPLQDYFLGVENKMEKRIADEYRDKVDPVYLKWAIRQVPTWKQVNTGKVLMHLHGDRDRIFPSAKVNPTHIIRGGGHFMIMNRADQIIHILETIVH